ncbi:MAG TPA: LarC family nickel insertion protein [Dictyobacter sp.]|nr:LarC family nickel insertion protein [Dictyobacter sp.]
MGQTVAYLDAQLGMTEEMLLGAFFALGYSVTEFVRVVAALHILPEHVQLREYDSAGIHGMRLIMQTDALPERICSINEVEVLLAQVPLSLTAREKVAAIMQRLFDAQSTVSGQNSVPLALSYRALVRNLATAIGVVHACEAFHITHLSSSPLPLSGVPAPETLELLRQAHAPCHATMLDGERITPICAAIVAELVHFEPVVFTIEQLGYGFSGADFVTPAYTRLCIGTTNRESVAPCAQHKDGADTDWITVIESNVDTMTGELLGGLMERLLEAGALDVSYTPLQMKKNRPATLITVMCRLEDGERLAYILLSETSTLGVRMQRVQRLKARRYQTSIETPFGPLLVKVKRLGARIISTAPEYEECARVAREQHIPLADVYERVRQAISNAMLE